MNSITLYLTDPNYDRETDGLTELLNGIAEKFEPCFMVGTVGRWNGSFNGYKYLESMEDLRCIISNYEEIKIAQVGTRLRLRLSHHDGTHYMEVRKLTKSCIKS